MERNFKLKRKFHGKIYNFDSRSYTKKSAEIVAKSCRETGYNAVIIKGVDGGWKGFSTVYRIYTRKK